MKSLSVVDSKKLQLNLLSSIHDFCTEHHLKYYMIWGTLLGAVRHKGFIPWDDDIDIIMFREDYDAFCSMYHDENAKIVDCRKDNGYYLPFAKVVDTRTVLKENIKSDMEIGVYVDIFVLDAVSHSSIKNKLAVWRLLLYRDLLMLGVVPESDKRKGFRKILYNIMRPMSKIMSMNKISKKMDSIAKNLACFEKNHVFYAPLLELDPRATKCFRYLYEQFGEGCLLEFENFKFYAPVKYVEILKNCYGDFMIFPPEKDRVSHHEYEQYWK